MTDGTAREDIREYEAMDAGDNNEPGPQKCKANCVLVVFIRSITFTRSQ